MGPRAGLDWCGKTRPHRHSIPGPCSPYRVAVPTELSRSTERRGLDEFGIRQVHVAGFCEDGDETSSHVTQKI